MFWNRFAQIARWYWFSGKNFCENRLSCGTIERWLACQHLVRQRSKRKNIRPRRQLALGHRLLGTHVVWSAECHARVRHSVVAGFAGRQCNSEISYERASVVKQNVGRLDVAVNDSMSMCVVEGG